MTIMRYNISTEERETAFKGDKEKMEKYKTSIYENDIMPRLFIEVLNAGDESLKSRPYRPVYDMAIACRLDMHGHSVPVTNDMLMEYGIPADELIREAILNSPVLNPPAFFSVTEFTGVADNRVGMHVLTTKGVCRAASLFYPGEMERTEYKMGGGYIIIPSSVCEFLIMPDDDVTLEDAKELSEFIKETNGDESCVSYEEILSDTPYHYANGVFEPLESYVMHQKGEKKNEQRKAN